MKHLGSYAGELMQVQVPFMQHNTFKSTKKAKKSKKAQQVLQSVLKTTTSFLRDLRYRHNSKQPEIVWVKNSNHTGIAEGLIDSL